jgi:alpha-L-rhamnosidase
MRCYFLKRKDVVYGSSTFNLFSRLLLFAHGVLIVNLQNLATKLASHAAEPITVHEQFKPVEVTKPLPGVWLFSFSQNFAGWPVLKLPELPACVSVRVAPSESLFANGTIDQSSLGPGSRGRDLFFTYTTAGHAGGETWHTKCIYARGGGFKSLACQTASFLRPI